MEGSIHLCLVCAERPRKLMRLTRLGSLVAIEESREIHLWLRGWGLLSSELGEHLNKAKILVHVSQLIKLLVK